jgi:hypothetical protein
LLGRLDLLDHYTHPLDALDRIGMGKGRARSSSHRLATMIYGYARVSTAAQDESGQVAQLKAAGCEKVFREKITGTTADRPQLRALMKKLAPGDVV